jgi:hypothetical protein
MSSQFYREYAKKPFQDTLQSDHQLELILDPTKYVNWNNCNKPIEYKTNPVEYNANDHTYSKAQFKDSVSLYNRHKPSFKVSKRQDHQKMKDKLQADFIKESLHMKRETGWF